jgi:DnaJ-class molecular chaperone
MSSFITRNARGVRQNSVTRAPDIPNVFFPNCLGWDAKMQKTTDPKKQKCKNCEGKGTLKKGDKVVRCQRCGGSGIKR